MIMSIWYHNYMNDNNDIFTMLVKRLLIMSVVITIWSVLVVYGAYAVAETIAPLFKQQEGNFDD